MTQVLDSSFNEYVLIKKNTYINLLWLKLKLVFSCGGEEPQPQRYRELK